MNAFDILGDPVRRRILELLARADLTSGEIVHVIADEFGISQPAVSYQLKILRQNGFATVRPDAQRRIYSINAEPLVEVDAWLGPFRQFWNAKLDALATEVARGKRARRKASTHPDDDRPS